MVRAVTEDKSVIYCPFSCVVDTREQAPFHFLGMVDDQSGKPIVVPLITGQHLDTGDYSIAGLEREITIERKSVSDFAGSITHERDRFEREMERMKVIVDAGGYAAVVIEGDWQDLFNYSQRSRVGAKSMSRTMASWSIRYGVHWWPMTDRRHAELWTFRLLQMYHRIKQHTQDEPQTIQD